MKKIAIYSFVLTAIVAAITVYNQFYNLLTFNIALPMWAFLLLLLFPFLGFALYCFVVARFDRQFKIGDIAYSRYNDDSFTVVDYCRYRPSVVILQKNAKFDPYNLSAYTRLDFALHEKYLYRKDPLTRSERYKEYCKKEGVKITEGSMTEV